MEAGGRVGEGAQLPKCPPARLCRASQTFLHPPRPQPSRHRGAGCFSRKGDPGAGSPPHPLWSEVALQP